jgi:L-asparaginase / beta-aspartyl-peptidase
MWAIILHGGAKEIAPEDESAHRRGCARALEAGSAILRSGGSAADAVAAAITVLEDDPTFNAGFGSAVNAEGEIEMCSALMEGTKFNVGAVTLVSRVRNPITVARTMLYDEPILLGGSGAESYAEEKNLELCSPAALLPEERRSANGRHDTVGCAALDTKGCVAVGTSTGGIEGNAPGRVGDSPQPGCGFYADDKLGAVAFSGDGEHIARKISAARVMLEFDAADPATPLREALREIEAIGGEAGAIALTRDGKFAWEHNSKDFAVAYQSSEMQEGRTFTNKAEEA